MSSFAGEVVSTLPSNPNLSMDDGQVVEAQAQFTNNQVLNKFKQFVRNFTDDHTQFIYRDQLLANYQQNTHYLEIDLSHVMAFDSEIHSLIQTNPGEYVPILEDAIKQVIVDIYYTQGVTANDVNPFQAILKNFPKYTELRRLDASDISRLVTIRGIVTGATKPRVKATNLCIMCRNCKAIKRIRVSSGNSNITLPRKCDGGSRQAAGADAPKCPNDPFVPIPDASEYTNVQFLKLQESPEAVPTGEMPRHVNLSCERYLVGQVKPGTRITVVGVQMAFAAKRMGQDKKNGVNDVGIRIPYVRILSIEQDSDANDILLGKLTPEDQEEVQNLVNNSNDIYKDVASSIAPAILGRDDIKKAIACALFGGSRKVLPDGMSLRGDINILLLGDPSVAKSQLLKFASQAAPIAVYTSGKGSSAAGLTASVIKNPSSGEFSLEGGALVLADGGMVCIDEFDKMRDQDRVAIHEAMEQQTISIAKAGITTILNSRTSVLAAANPVFGRYDDSKDASDNIDFQTTILSRFDLIFIIRDMQDEDLDRQLASHIIRVHAGGEAMVQEEHPDLISPDKLKKFIAYARRIQPRLNDEAAATLANHYVRFRQDMANNRRKAREDPNSTGAAQVIPITVRQLEAIVRISEAIARMSLSTVATPAHVEEALRLFNVATLQAAASPLSQVIDSPAFLEHVQRAEVCLTRGLPVGATVATREIMRKVISEGHDERAVKRAVDRMVGSQSLVFLNQRKMIRRHK